MALWIASLTAVVGLLGIAALTIHRLAAAPESLTSWSDEGKDGTASVTGCDVRGPIGPGGVGYYWACTADVTTPAGTLAGVQFLGELTPDDAGKPVAVENDEGEWLRNISHPYWSLDYVIGIYLAIFALCAVAMHLATHQVLKEEEPDETAKAEFVANAVTMPVRHHEELKSNRDSGKLTTGLGLSLVVFAGFIGWLVFELRITAFWDPAYLVSGVFFLLGVVITIYGLREKTVPDVATFFVEPEGLRVQLSDGRGTLLRWSLLERVVFEPTHTLGIRKTASVQLVPSPREGDGLHAWIRGYFRGVRATYGYELSPGAQLPAATKFSKLIERQSPGLTRWPRREVRRWGFGLFGLVDRFRRTGRR
ncbi:hypothetical protein B0293_18300 [Amycolatopsis azurea DSM 43854]|nr:hypothetical protein B0293_18300 [Amycolatopsis azurea DSM 43854]